MPRQVFSEHLDHTSPLPSAACCTLCFHTAVPSGPPAVQPFRSCARAWQHMHLPACNWQGLRIFLWMPKTIRSGLSNLSALAVSSETQRLLELLAFPSDLASAMGCASVLSHANTCAQVVNASVLF